MCLFKLLDSWEKTKKSKDFARRPLAQVMDELELDLNGAVDRAQHVGVRMLFPVPKGAQVLCVRDKPKDREPLFVGAIRFEGILPRDVLEKARILDVVYLVISPNSITSLYENPRFLRYCISEVAKRAGFHPPIRVVSLLEALYETPKSEQEWSINPEGKEPILKDKISSQSSDMIFWLDQESQALWDPANIYILDKELYLMRYPHGVDDHGDFEPNENTPQMVCDLNTAYYLFRVKSPILEHYGDSKAKAKVRNWLRATWDPKDPACPPKGNRKIPNSQLLDTIANIILGRSKICLGSQQNGIEQNSIEIDSDVRARQQSGAPEWLMVFDQLAQWRSQDDRNYYCQVSFKQEFSEKGVKPARYLEALHFATHPR